MSSATLIIPAAGSGSRLDKAVPKPFILIAGKTILEHTVRRFLSLKILSQVIIATSPEYISEAQKILGDTLPTGIVSDVVEGGKQRQHSIVNALDFVIESELVIIHDAVRPFVKLSQIEECCEAAFKVGASVLGVPAKDTIKQLDDNHMILDTPARKYLWQAQTPQVFTKEVIHKAYEKAIEDQFIGTDDASLVERLGLSVKMIEGDRSNFKITYPLDLKLAQLLLEQSDDG